MAHKTTDQLEIGDIVLNSGMRILIDGPARVYPEHGSASGTVYAWPGLVLNADALCNKNGPDYNNYIACHLRGQWFEDRMEPKRKDSWTIQGNNLARWHMGEPWREVDSLMETGADSGYGGDVQAGKTYSRRFTHTKLLNRVLDVVAYPVRGDETTPMIPSGEIWIESTTATIICTDIDDVGGTSVWDDTSSADLPERYYRPYDTVRGAEEAARHLIETFDPEHIGWDGAPNWVLECRYNPEHMMREVPATQSLYCGPLHGKVPACTSCADFHKATSEGE